MATRLITIPFSHYCEKARWALQRCDLAFAEDAHLPLLHVLPARRAGGGRTVPVLVADDEVHADSTDIVAWADARRPGVLLPAAPDDRAEALALEDDFDRHLGPAARRWAYFHLLPRRDVDALLVRDVPRWQRLAFKATRPLVVRALQRGLKLDAAGAERSRAKIDDTFARVARHLGDGRRYLVGDTPTVADLTFAALAAPIVLPPEHPVAMPALDSFADAPRAQLLAWRGSIAGAHALRMYREHRAERIAAGVRRDASA